MRNVVWLQTLYPEGRNLEEPTIEEVCAPLLHFPALRMTASLLVILETTSIQATLEDIQPQDPPLKSISLRSIQPQ